MTEPTTEIGWQILDADGNVIDSGPISFAEVTSELQEALDAINNQEG